MFKVNVIEAFKRGEVQDRVERKAELEQDRPTLVLEIYHHFFHIPVFNMANVMNGANNFLEGWKGTLQFEHNNLTSLCASTHRSVEGIRKGSIPISSRRVMAPAASLVCSVLNTR